MWYVIPVVLVLLIGAFFWWRQRTSNQDDQPMLSFVALLKEPQHLETIYVQTAARKAWNADLGTSEIEGGDGFVVGHEGLPTIIVKYHERMFMINNFPQPYMDDPASASESIADLRLQGLVAEHTAWLSCDAMGVESFDDLDEVREWYRLLGSLISELVDDNCLAIYLPQTDQIFANMDETLELLISDDPLAALGDEAYVPVVPIKDDDPRMIAAVAEARQRWPEFVAAFEKRTGENFSVKAPITAGGNTEFIWLEVTAVENGVIYGELANDPISLGNLKLGSRTKTTVEELNDWAFFQNGEPQGMFTVKVLMDASKEKTNEG